MRYHHLAFALCLCTYLPSLTLTETEVDFSENLDLSCINTEGEELDASTIYKITCKTREELSGDEEISELVAKFSELYEVDDSGDITLIDEFLNRKIPGRSTFIMNIPGDENSQLRIITGKLDTKEPRHIAANYLCFEKAYNGFGLGVFQEDPICEISDDETHFRLLFKNGAHVKNYLTNEAEFELENEKNMAFIHAKPRFELYKNIFSLFKNFEEQKAQPCNYHAENLVFNPTNNEPFADDLSRIMSASKTCLGQWNGNYKNPNFDPLYLPMNEIFQTHATPEKNLNHYNIIILIINNEIDFIYNVSNNYQTLQDSIGLDFYEAYKEDAENVLVDSDTLDSVIELEDDESISLSDVWEQTLKAIRKFQKEEYPTLEDDEESTNKFNEFIEQLENSLKFILDWIPEFGLSMYKDMSEDVEWGDLLMEVSDQNKEKVEFEDSERVGAMKLPFMLVFSKLSGHLDENLGEDFYKDVKDKIDEGIQKIDYVYNDENWEEGESQDDEAIEERRNRLMVI